MVELWASLSRRRRRPGVISSEMSVVVVTVDPFDCFSMVVVPAELVVMVVVVDVVEPGDAGEPFIDEPLVVDPLTR